MLSYMLSVLSVSALFFDFCVYTTSIVLNHWKGVYIFQYDDNKLYIYA